MIRSAVAAAVVAAHGGGAIVVGSTALWLHGEDIAVNDLDLVPHPSSLDALPSALEPLCCLSTVPRRTELCRSDIVSRDTSFGRVDLLVERGRRDFERLATHAVTLPVMGIPVLVASSQDAWDLRHRFKDLDA